MQIRRIERGATVGRARGEVVACLPVASGPEPWPDLARRIATVPPSVPVLVTGASGEELEALATGAPEAGHESVWVVEDVAGALAAAAPADVVLVQSGCRPAGGWLERLRAAAYAGSATATASALTSSRLGLEDPGVAADASAAEAVAAAALALRPRTLTPDRACVYVRRTALELAGPYGDGFAEHCLAVGMAHVLADDVLVASADDCTGPPSGGRPQGTLGRALGVARRVLVGMALIIDARPLEGPLTGTHVAALELLGALARHVGEEVGLAVLLSRTAPPHALEVLGRLPDIEVVLAPDRPKRHADLVHRPFQVSTPADLAVLAGLGDRLLVTQHDLISYHNPSYFPDRAHWEGYRELTQAALAVADGVVFGSEEARAQALAEDLLEPARASVAGHGVDHRLLAAPAPERPPGLERLGSPPRPFLLCLGTDFAHKNRPFALRLLGELRETHGWRGALVFAGPPVRFGSSRTEERDLLAAGPALREALIELGAVTEAEKRWLLERAALVVYPSVQEGFGLVPFEAAAQGTPSVWAAESSLAEILPSDAAAIVPWDLGATAARTAVLLHDDAARTELMSAIRAAAEGLTWDANAARLLEIYRRTCDGPPSPAGVRERASGLMRGGVSEDAMRLVGPDGALPAELERPLLALASHSRIAAPAFAALRNGYALSQRLRRSGR